MENVSKLIVDKMRELDYNDSPLGLFMSNAKEVDISQVEQTAAL